MRTTAPSTDSLSPKTLGVVITGSSKGVGRALAEQFIRKNDAVVISSRTLDTMQRTVDSLRRRYPTSHIFGCVADVRKHEDVVRLLDFAGENLGTINAFICNAGIIGPKQTVKHLKPQDIEDVIATNLVGPMFCAKETQRLAALQQHPMHVFIMDGSGTRGNSTAGYAAYGASKRSIPQLVSSLNKEANDENIRFHTMSPGMVLTDLLLGENQDPKFRKIFNCLAEEPETVATELVPQLRSVILADKKKTYIAYLTIPRAFFRLTTNFLFGFRRNKFFDQITGNRVDDSNIYSETGVRIED